MATGFKFEDNSKKISANMRKACEKILTEIGQEFITGIHRSYAGINSRETKGSYRAELESTANEVKIQIGSDKVNAIYEEFGTGAYAEEGGRQGFWVYVNDGSPAEEPKGTGKVHTFESAMQAVAMLKSEGYDAHMTQGKHARRHMRNTYEQNKNKFISIAQKEIGVKLNEL